MYLYTRDLPRGNYSRGELFEARGWGVSAATLGRASSGVAGERTRVYIGDSTSTVGSSSIV